ncbi:Pyridoxamine kinase [Serratia odorifera]|nr:Pyridoxamine kinase [Serratia odorifera]
MGHPEKGCIVAPGVAEFLCQQALPCSDMIAPNVLELEQLSQRQITNVAQAVDAARALIAKGPKVVLVKHLSRAGYHLDCFEMLLVTVDDAWHISRPLVDFGARQPVGVGDLTSGLLLVNLLKGVRLAQALEHVTAAVYEVMLTTQEMGEYELQVVAAQEGIVAPRCHFAAQKL